MTMGQVIHAEALFGRASALMPPELWVNILKKNPTIDEAREAIFDARLTYFHPILSPRIVLAPGERMFGGQPMYLDEHPGDESSLLVRLAPPVDLWYATETKGKLTRLSVSWVWVYFQGRGRAYSWAPSSLEEARRVMKNPNLA